MATRRRQRQQQHLGVPRIFPADSSYINAAASSKARSACAFSQLRSSSSERRVRLRARVGSDARLRIRVMGDGCAHWCGLPNLISSDAHVPAGGVLVDPSCNRHSFMATKTPPPPLLGRRCAAGWYGQNRGPVARSQWLLLLWPTPQSIAGRVSAFDVREASGTLETGYCGPTRQAQWLTRVDCYGRHRRPKSTKLEPRTRLVLVSGAL